MIHYKFKSRLEPDVLRIQGYQISVREFKEKIMDIWKFDAQESYLVVKNPASDEEYLDDQNISANSSILLFRLPLKQHIQKVGTRYVRRFNHQKTPVKRFYTKQDANRVRQGGWRRYTPVNSRFKAKK